MKKAMYAVFGASGFGREVMPIARWQLAKEGHDLEPLVFVDDKPPSAVLNGHPVLTYPGFLGLDAEQRYAAIAVADGHVRQQLALRMVNDGIRPWRVQAENVVVLDEVTLAEGAILCPFVTLTSNIMIGKYFHANLYSYVAHDCTIGDFVTFAPGVKCNGNVVIGDYAYIGTGAVIRQGKPGQPLVIGKNAVVGMGAVVTKSVPDGMTVVGNPAKPLIKNERSL